MRLCHAPSQPQPNRRFIIWNATSHTNVGVMWTSDVILECEYSEKYGARKVKNTYNVLVAKCIRKISFLEE
jgi:hypothetical protein